MFPAETDLPERILPKESGYFPHFCEKLGHPELKEKITYHAPAVSLSLDCYNSRVGLKGAGGLGTLVADKQLETEKLGIPSFFITPFYPRQRSQHLNHFIQEEHYTNVHPENFCFRKAFSFNVRANGDTIPIQMWRNGNFISPYEEGLGEVYQGDSNCEHRLYQMTVNGYALSALCEIGFDPSVIQLEESSQALGPLFYMDLLCQKGLSFEEAYSLTRKKTLLTNHTLVPAACNFFYQNDFEKYVFTNIKSPSVRDWLSNILRQNSGCLSMDTLAFTLAGKANGVSRLHCQIANENYRSFPGGHPEFQTITNGVSLDRWLHPGFLYAYKGYGVVDNEGLPSADYKCAIDSIDPSTLYQIKTQAREELIRHLKSCKDQYGNPIDIPKDKLLYCWGRRLAEYKRLNLLLENPERLSEILENQDIYILIAGRAHTRDIPMKQELHRILNIVNARPSLRQRFIFIQDYDDIMTEKLVSGVDVWLNTPRCGREACGTSWAEAVLNYTLLISTIDGGVADVPDPHILTISGQNYHEEVESYYQNLNKAAEILKDVRTWKKAGDWQLKDYLPTIAGGRMMGDYLNLMAA